MIGWCPSNPAGMKALHGLPRWHSGIRQDLFEIQEGRAKKSAEGPLLTTL